jgi:nitrate/nitrite transport system substrate-binding protein
VLGYIALTDASAVVIAKEKGLFAKHGVPNVEVAKEPSWGATRDNLSLGSERKGIDGAHILSPMPYLMTAGKITQNNVPEPIYLLARLNYDCQAISLANEYKDLKIGLERRMYLEGHDQRRPAAGLDLRSHPLECGDRIGRLHRRSGLVLH